MKDSTLEAIFMIIILVGWVMFRVWQADGNTRCFFANDPATCATVLNTR